MVLHFFSKKKRNHVLRSISSNSEILSHTEFPRFINYQKRERERERNKVLVLSGSGALNLVEFHWGYDDADTLISFAPPSKAKVR